MNATIKQKSNRGGKREGSGRPKGSKDRATIEQKGTIEELARAHTPVALAALVHVATKSQSDNARVAAACAIIDRGYGKPRQAIEHSGTITHATEMTDAELIETIRSAGAVDAPPDQSRLN